MQIKDLKAGDVLLFSAEKGSFISWAITFLTNAPVSHAAMFYDPQNGTIIEETPPRVAINNAATRFPNRTIYVNRLDGALPMDPVVNAATHYLNNDEPYDSQGLYIVGLLLIYRKFTPRDRTQKAIIKILKKLTASITDYLHKHKTPGKKPMVCSQFVAQCFEDAGAGYRLQLHNPVLNDMANRNLLSRAMEQFSDNIPNDAFTLSAMHDVQEDDEALCRELKEALEAEQGMTTNSDFLDPELINVIAQFAAVNERAEAPYDANRPPQLNGTAMARLQTNLSMYVFPGDLLSHCKNLKQIGKVEI